MFFLFWIFRADVDFVARHLLSRDVLNRPTDEARGSRSFPNAAVGNLGTDGIGDLSRDPYKVGPYLL